MHIFIIVIIFIILIFFISNYSRDLFHNKNDLEKLKLGIFNILLSIGESIIIDDTVKTETSSSTSSQHPP